MQLEESLRKYFGFESFRSGQREVIEHVLAGQDTLAVLPTGLGKSLCYQLPAQLLDGITLVISPLIALMRDQVEALRNRGFKNATFLNSSLDPAVQGSRYEEIEDGWYKLVYVAPERCDSPRFRTMLSKAKVSLLVIDEAHCISQWGHDFRPQYRTLLKRLPELREATVLAMTATATPEVQRDIISVLERKMELVVADFNRPNLTLEVIEVEDREEKDAGLFSMVGSDEQGAAIVYTSTRKEAEAVCAFLQRQNVSACLYHAGLSTNARTEAYHQFREGRRRVIVATVAFGMGIDKPDVRRVIHYNIPGSLEAYYQEAGRAGRDGLSATCTLLFSNQDLRVQEFLLESSYPDHTVVYQVYDVVRGANPLPVASIDIAKSTELPELSVKSALQLMYEQGHLAQNGDGKYTATRPDSARPGINFRPLLERARRARQRLNTMIEYAAHDSCRRAAILSYFGQKYTPPCGACDVCAPAFEPKAVEGNKKSDRVARVILSAVDSFGGRLGRTLISEVLTGSKRKRLLEMRLDETDLYARLKLFGKDRTLEWLDELIDRKLLATTHGNYPVVYLTPRGRKALEGTDLIGLQGLQLSSAPALSSPSAPSTSTLSAHERSARDTKPATADENALRIEVEMWRQGGPAPESGALVRALDSAEISQGDLVVFINVLGEIDSRESGPVLRQKLAETMANGADANIAAALCNSLGRLGVLDSAGDLVKLLDDPRAMVRGAAVRALGRLRVTEALDKLVELAEYDSAASVRLAARAAVLLTSKFENTQTG